MNMHGFITPVRNAEQRRSSPQDRLLAWMRKKRPFLLIVVAPVLILAAYLYLVASDEYQSEAHFVIQSASGNTSPTGFGDLLGAMAPVSPTQSQAMGVSDYLSSQDAVNTLQKQINLVAMFQRPEVDAISKLRPMAPTPERLLDYYNGKVKSRFNRDNGITTLEVRAFRPADAYALTRKLLELGEARVNTLNQRAYNDGVRASEKQLANAEQNARDIEVQMTAYRQQHADIDPTTSGEAQTTLLTNMQRDLASARSQLSLMGKMVSASSPQYRAMVERVHSLEAEVSRQQGQLTGAGSTVASRLGGYEDLKIRQTFAAKRYESAAAALEKARDQAQRQSLYLLRVVDPVMPVKSEYPQRFLTLLTVFLSLSVAYSIGWLIVAGVREHTA